MITGMRHIRKYIMKDPDETLPAARERYRRLVLADKTIRTILYGTLAFYYCNWVAVNAL